jgi:hypothetical protein
MIVQCSALIKLNFIQVIHSLVIMLGIKLQSNLNSSNQFIEIKAKVNGY